MNHIQFVWASSTLISEAKTVKGDCCSLIELKETQPMQPISAFETQLVTGWTFFPTKDMASRFNPINHAIPCLKLGFSGLECWMDALAWVPLQCRAGSKTWLLFGMLRSSVITVKGSWRGSSYLLHGVAWFTIWAICQCTRFVNIYSFVLSHFWVIGPTNNACDSW